MGCIILERLRRRSTSPLGQSKEGARDYAVASAHTWWLVVQNCGDGVDGIAVLIKVPHYGGIMRTALLVASFVGVTSVALAGDLDWAYPPTPKPEPGDDVVHKSVPGSARQFTQLQIDAPFDVPDWYPEEHPSMPPIVAHGVKPLVQACARCHLPSGDGHPESSRLAGLPVPYIIRQVAAFRNDERKGVRADHAAPTQAGRDGTHLPGGERPRQNRRRNLHAQWRQPADARQEGPSTAGPEIFQRVEQIRWADAGYPARVAF
jgi:hypothetical protein